MSSHLHFKNIRRSLIDTITIVSVYKVVEPKMNQGNCIENGIQKYSSHVHLACWHPVLFVCFFHHNSTTLKMAGLNTHWPSFSPNTVHILTTFPDNLKRKLQMNVCFHPLLIIILGVGRLVLSHQLVKRNHCARRGCNEMM